MMLTDDDAVNDLLVLHRLVVATPNDSTYAFGDALAKYIDGTDRTHELVPVFRFTEGFAALVRAMVTTAPETALDLDEAWSSMVSKMIDTGLLLDPLAALDSVAGSVDADPIEEALRRWGSVIVSASHQLDTDPQ